MGNIEIAKETIKITADRKYYFEGNEVKLPELDYQDVIVISPEAGERVLQEDIPFKNDNICDITVTNADSFQAGRRYDNPLIMNFANAHKEALCRCSTLYESITSKKASEMYKYNNTHLSKVESDYMLISPNVVVFRDEKYQFLETPVIMGVVTVPAPNRYGAALLAGKKLIEDTFLRRIRIMLKYAAKCDYRTLVLGAWGCGAFGNKPDDVSRYFKQVIVDEEYGRYFDEICFAIFGNEDGKNITEFKKTFDV